MLRLSASEIMSFDMNSFGIRQKWIAAAIGAAFMVIALVPQIITQEIPSIVFILRYGASKGIQLLSEFELSNPIIWGLFIGGTAAFYQESMKYFAVNTQSKYLSFWIGLGFALIDIAVLLIQSTIPLQRTHSLLLLVLISLNAISSLMFHPGTALILKFGRTVRRGVYFLLFTILLHGVEDGGLVFVDVFVLKHPSLYLTTVTAFWVASIAISLISLILGLHYKGILLSKKDDENLI